jgi:hypothetical protein
LPSGTEATINAALAGPDAKAVLCPGAVFDLSDSVRFTAPDQQLVTEGRPTDDSRAILRIVAPTLSTAIDGVDISRVSVQNVQVDGARPTLGEVAGAALIELGGIASGQIVSHVYAHDTRSWSTLHFGEGSVAADVPSCQHATIIDNVIGPAGTPDDRWADGITLGCGQSIVQGNTVRDATDGGIVVVGAPGSIVKQNTIVALSQVLLGGITMVDYAPLNGDYAGTVVTDNVINAEGALIKVGVAMGPQVWSCAAGTNRGGAVTGNTLEGAFMGYGYAINGVSQWTASGNLDLSRHVGAAVPGCGGAVAAPAGFLVQAATASHLQAQFKPARLTDVLGLHG